MFIEFAGENDVLEYILNAGFVVFDSEYLLITDRDPDRQFWRPFRTGFLSTGRPYYRAWPIELPSDPDEYCDVPEGASAVELDLDRPRMRTRGLSQYLSRCCSSTVTGTSQSDPPG
jgi:hypothetical protein